MRAAAQEREQASLGHAELGGVTRHPKSQDWSWTLEGEFPEGSRSELPEKLNMRPHKTPQTRGKRGQERRNNGETRTKPGRGGEVWFSEILLNFHTRVTKEMKVFLTEELM